MDKEEFETGDRDYYDTTVVIEPYENEDDRE